MRGADRIAVHLRLADVAELADAQASGACALRGVEVRLLSSALSLLFLSFPRRRESTQPALSQALPTRRLPDILCQFNLDPSERFWASPSEAKFDLRAGTKGAICRRTLEFGWRFTREFF